MEALLSVDGLIVEWLDTTLDPASPTAANQNSEACQAVNVALAPPAAAPANGGRGGN